MAEPSGEFVEGPCGACMGAGCDVCASESDAYENYVSERYESSGEASNGR